jgi:hypothetical protein
MGWICSSSETVTLSVIRENDSPFDLECRRMREKTSLQQVACVNHKVPAHVITT